LEYLIQTQQIDPPFFLDERWRVALDKRKIEPYGTETQQAEPLPYNSQEPDLG